MCDATGTDGHPASAERDRRSEPVRHTIRYWFATVEDLLGFGARAPEGAAAGEGDRPA